MFCNLWCFQVPDSRSNLLLTPRFNAVAGGVAGKKTVSNGFSLGFASSTRLKPGVTEKVFYKACSGF